MNKLMTVVNYVAFVCAVLSLISSLVAMDWTEAMAWGVVTMYSIKEVFLNAKS